MDLLGRVKELCLEKGISQRKLEAELGLSNGASSKWNTSSPSGDVLQKIADYFDITVDYLLGRTAFKNNFELFEHWGYSHNGFEAAFDFGELLKNERDEQGISQEQVREDLKVKNSDVQDIEEGLLPLNYDLAEKYAKFLGTTVSQIFFDNNMYDEYVPEEYHHNVTGYEKIIEKSEDEARREFWGKDKQLYHYFAITYGEEELIRKYRMLPQDGKQAIDYILEREYRRIKQTSNLHLLPNAAHEIEGASEEDKAHDDKLMDDDNF